MTLVLLGLVAEGLERAAQLDVVIAPLRVLGDFADCCYRQELEQGR